MTKQQRGIILCGVLLIVLMGLFPPWMAIERTAHPQRRFSGYHFVIYSGEGYARELEKASMALMTDEERDAYDEVMNEKPSAATGGTGYASKFKFDSNETRDSRYNHEIYLSALMIQWLCVLLLTGVVYIMCGRIGDDKFKWNLDGHLRANAAREYLYFLKFIVVGIIALPIIRFSIFWLSVGEFNWGTFNITGNLAKYYANSWAYIFAPYILFLLIRSIVWAKNERKKT